MLKLRLRLLLLLTLMSVYRIQAQMDLIGANLEGIADWSRGHAFVDLVKQSRQLGHPDQPWNANLGLPTIGADGWPTSDFGIILWIDVKTPMNGTYKVIYVSDGMSKISLVASKGSLANHLYNTTSKIGTVDLIFPIDGTQMMLSFKNTTNGVRNLKVIRPGYDAVNPPTFTTSYINHHKRFNTFRFMDWGHTNGNPIRYWSERPTKNNITASGDYGVPLEYMIEFGNNVGKDVWICIPHQADDDYVRNTALLIQSQLNTNLAVYIEYSNEVWNWQFSQAHWNLNAATQEANGTASNLNYDSINNPGYWAWRRTARRIKEISDIFRSVFGDSQMMTRIRPVLAGQIAFVESMKTGLKFINDVYGPPKNFFYALAGAPYFNLNGGDSGNLTKDDVLTLMEKNILSMKTNGGIQDFAALSAVYSLPVMAYEGGSDTFGPNAVQAKKIASFDPKMETLCIDYLNIWYSYGFGLFNWFFSGATDYDSVYGTWGLTDVMTNLDTPKIRAIDYVRAQDKPPLTFGPLVPGFIDGRSYMGNNKDPLQYSSYPTRYSYGVLDYLLRSDVYASYYLTVNVGTYATTAIRVQVNSVVFDLILSGNNNQPALQAYINVDLPAGLNYLKIFPLNNSIIAFGFTFTRDQPAPIITSPLNVFAIAGLYFTHQIKAANFPFSFKAVNLPKGLSLNATTGVISGVASVSGTFFVQLYSVNGGGATGAVLNLTLMSSLLLQENFYYTDGQSDGCNGGTGFQEPWIVQNGRVEYYRVASGSPLSFNGTSFSSYLTGGGGWMACGRRIDTRSRFKSFLDTNMEDIGADGSVLWFSVLIRKQKSNNEPCYVSLHPKTSVIWISSETRISIGYFGSETNNNNRKYWGIKSGTTNAVYAANTNLTLNTTARLVMKLTFGFGINNDNVSLYVNPNPQIEPTLPNAVLSAITIQFKSLAYYAGQTTDESSIDDLKLGVSYSSLNL